MSEKRSPDAAMRALDRLVGTWDMTGDAKGTVTYRWLAGAAAVPASQPAKFSERGRSWALSGLGQPSALAAR